MKKMILLLLGTIALIPASVSAQRRARETVPVYTHVPCTTPGAKEERPIDLRIPSDAADAKNTDPSKNDRKRSDQPSRGGCVVEAPPQRR